MTYQMKREILMMFMRMNENLFDALPSMLQDELLDETSGPSYPEPYSVNSVTRGSVTYYDGFNMPFLPEFSRTGHSVKGLVGSRAFNFGSRFVSLA